jgi:hypothetical protein
MEFSLMDAFQFDSEDFEESEEWKQKTIERQMALFLGFPNGEYFLASLICRDLQDMGLLESMALVAVSIVKKHALGTAKAIFLATAEKQNFQARDLSVPEFIEVLELTVHIIYDNVLYDGTCEIEQFLSTYAELGGASVALRPIAPVFIHGLFDGLTEVVRSCPLGQASPEDFKNPCDALVPYGCEPKPVGIGQVFVQDSEMAVRRSWIARFHEEYNARLNSVFAGEEWSRVEPGQTHIKILRRLGANNMMSVTLDGDTYGASRPLVILLELTKLDLDIASKRFAPPEDIMKELFESIAFFSLGSTRELLQSSRTVMAPMLALSAAGLHCYARRIERIKDKFLRFRGRYDLVHLYSAKAKNELKTSYEAVMRRIEAVLIDAVEKEWVKANVDETTPKLATETTDKVFTLHKGTIDCLPASLLNPLFDRVQALLSTKYPGLLQGREETLIRTVHTIITRPWRVHRDSHRMGRMK